MMSLLKPMSVECNIRVHTCLEMVIVRACVASQRPHLKKGNKFRWLQMDNLVRPDKKSCRSEKAISLSGT